MSARWVTEGQLRAMMGKLIADRALRCARQARAEGREELARLWDFFTVNAIGQIQTGSDGNENGEPMNEDTAVIEAAEAYVTAGTHRNRARLERAVQARRRSRAAS